MKKVIYVRTTGIYDDSKATKEIFALLEDGFRVLVVGWDRFGNALTKCSDLFSQYSESITFCLYEKLVPNGGNIGTKNILTMLKWLIWARKVIKKHIGAEIVHLCNLDAALTMSRKMRRKVKIVYDIFDYYIDSHRIPKILERFIEGLEIAIINESAVTIICNEERREQISKAHPKKVVVLHNSPEIEKVNLLPTEYDYAYCGGLNEGRLIKETLENYAHNDDVKAAFAGFGKYEAEVKEWSDRYENFYYLGHMQYSDVLNIEGKSRVLSAIYNPIIRNHRLCAPNKFYESIALAKPVIVCRGTGIDKIVEKYNLGIVINYDASELFNAIRKLKDNPKLCEAMGKNGRILYEKEYTWKIMKKRLLEAYSDLDNN